MGMGINRPGFQLLSLAPPPESAITLSQTAADSPCLLPDQLSIYVSRYVPLLFLSVIAVFVSSWLKTQRKHRPDSLRLPTSNGTTRTSSNDVLLPYTRSGPDSAVWAALSPMSNHSRSPSPLGEITNARMPRSPSGKRGIGTGASSSTGGSLLTPTFRAYSPSTQLDSPGLLGVPPQHAHSMHGGDDSDDDNEDDPMLPAQYARRTPVAASDFGSQNSYFSLTGARTALRARGSDSEWSWTWRFPLGTRWRSVALGVPPSLEAYIKKRMGWSGMSRVDARGGKRLALLRCFALDLWEVTWPPFVVFLLIVMVMFW